MQVFKKGFTLILGLAMILSSTAFVFADDQPFTANDESVTMTVTVGEHGKVNDKTGTWTQQVTKATGSQSGQDVQLHIVADEGYVFGGFNVNGEPDQDPATSAFFGKSDLTMTIPGSFFQDNAAFEITFREKTAADDQTDPGTTPGTTDPGTTPGTTPGTDPGTTPSTDGQFTFSWTLNDASLGKVVQSLAAAGEGATSGTATYTAADTEELRTVAVVANPNALIDKVMINGTEDTKFKDKQVETYVLTTGNVNMEVTFKAKEGSEPTGETFKIETSAGEHGTITETIPSYVGGTEQTIVWTADFGYVVDTVTIDGTSVTENVGIGTAQGSTTFTTGNHTVAVTFKAETDNKVENGDAGKIELIANHSYTAGEDFKVQVIFTPASTEFDTDYVFESSDWEIVSTDKGTKDGKKITGTIPKGTAQETFNVVLKTSNVKSRFTVTFTQNGKTSSTYGEAVGYSGEAVDLSDGILGFLVGDDFFPYTSPSGSDDAYFESMTMLSAKADAVVKVAIEKDGQYYEASTYEVSGLDKTSDITAKELFESGAEVTTDGLEAYHCFTMGATFDSKYTVPAELATSGMQALITLEDEEVVDDGDDEDVVDENDGALDDDDTKVVKTGDETNMALYAISMFMSALLLVTLVFRRRVMNN